MAFSFGPDGVKGNNNFYPYDNGGTESGNYAVSSGNTDSGWVFLGNHQGGNPYPKKYYKIF